VSLAKADDPAVVRGSDISKRNSLATLARVQMMGEVEDEV
jgi:hypothetical protein